VIDTDTRTMAIRAGPLVSPWDHNVFWVSRDAALAGRPSEYAAKLNQINRVSSAVNSPRSNRVATILSPSRK